LSADNGYEPGGSQLKASSSVLITKSIRFGEDFGYSSTSDKNVSRIRHDLDFDLGLDWIKLWGVRIMCY